MELNTCPYCGKGEPLGKIKAARQSLAYTVLPQDLSCAKAQQKFTKCMSRFPIASLEHETVTARSVHFQLLASSPIYHSVHLSALIAF